MEPLEYTLEKVCVSLVVKVKSTLLLSLTTSVPVRPVVFTLMVYLVFHVAVTVMFLVMVPVALLLSVQVWMVG